jgi:hypothetical protein
VGRLHVLFVCEKQCIIFDTWRVFSVAVSSCVTKTQLFSAAQYVVITALSSLTAEREFDTTSDPCLLQSKVKHKHTFL